MRLRKLIKANKWGLLGAALFVLAGECMRQQGYVERGFHEMSDLVRDIENLPTKD